MTNEELMGFQELRNFQLFEIPIGREAVVFDVRTRLKLAVHIELKFLKKWIRSILFAFYEHFNVIVTGFYQNINNKK